MLSSCFDTAIIPVCECHGQLYIKLNDGNKMPMVGLGTWQATDEATVRKSVRSAIMAGYRLIDTAYAYCNEEAIGAELNDLFDEGIVKREDLFITTKLHLTFMGHEDVVPALDRQLQNLGLAYVDLYLIHWPIAFAKDSNDSLAPQDPLTGKHLFDYTKHYTETWKGMEDAQRLGLARSIGVSNFNFRQVEDILLRATIRPAVHQLESHPLLANQKVIEYCQLRRIAITAYSPFANPGNQYAPKGNVTYPNLMEDERLTAIAAKYPGKTPAHVMLRWQIQRGVAVIPKSNSEARIESNLNVFDFKLSNEDVEAINAMDKGIRICSFLDNGNSSSRDYPFDEYRDVLDAWA